MPAHIIDLKQPLRIHFIGIGGISMSGLAEILMERGFTVSGSDRAPSPLTEQLSKKGAVVMYPQSAENVKGRDIDLVVYTAAIHPDNPEFAECEARGLHMISRADLLGSIMADYDNSIAIAGTHGKTTTTSMITEVLLQDKENLPTVTVGAIDPSIGSNVFVGNSDRFVAEACEYSNSFLSFFPKVAVVLNVEAEHLDFFKTLENVRQGFSDFINNVKPGGTVVISADIEAYRELTKGLSVDRDVITFSLDEKKSPDVTARDITYGENGCPSFIPVYKGKEMERVTLSVPGDHNISNALSCIAAVKAICADSDDIILSDEMIIKGLSSFKGANRRFEMRGHYKGATVIDDYAHHPTEMRATFAAARRLPHERLIVVFQPHTYTRTRDFFDDFVEVLSEPDIVVLAPVYSAREKDVYGIHSTDIRDALAKKGKKVYAFDTFEEIKKFLSQTLMNGDLLITMGAGDVVKIADDITSDT